MTTSKVRSTNAKRKAQFTEYNTALRMMRAIVKRIHKEVDRLRPDYAYAFVESWDNLSRTALVYYPDAPDSTFPVNVGTLLPFYQGQKVRIHGNAGDKFIDGIPGGASSDLPPGTVVLYPSTAFVPLGWLQCDGSTFDTTTYFNLGLVLPGGTLPNPTAPSGLVYIIKA